MKNLSAGKLESHAQVGRFISYDSESKGYRTYWLKKYSISIEWNVIFDEKDIQSPDNEIILGDILAEGEKEKAIQSTQSQQSPNYLTLNQIKWNPVNTLLLTMTQLHLLQNMIPLTIQLLKKMLHYQSMVSVNENPKVPINNSMKDSQQQLHSPTRMM